jgi:hypothetical protein
MPKNGRIIINKALLSSYFYSGLAGYNLTAADARPRSADRAASRPTPDKSLEKTVGQRPLNR